MTREFLLFSGSANPDLTRDVAQDLGCELGRCEIERFPDGEVSVRLLETVRRKEVFILQPTGPPVDDNLVELLCFADAARRAAADRVTAIMPYFGYARADKRGGKRQAIAARMVGDVLQAVGIDQVITVDLHAAQIEGFFTIPVDALTAVPLLAGALKQRDRTGSVVVAPDEGRVRMARDYAQRLEIPMVIAHKRRESATRTEVAQIVGDVEGKQCIVIDDMIATGGTLVTVMDALRAAGAQPDITIAATHGVLLPGAREKLDRDEVTEILVTNTLATPHPDWPKLRVLSIARTISAAVQAFMRDRSLSPLF